MLSFIVPVKHPDNTRELQHQTAIIASTLKSLSLQEGENWQIVIVANQGTVLPELPDRTTLVKVDFPANPMFERYSQSLEETYAAVYLDKGKRVLAGIMAVPNSDYYMVCDEDDFVHRSLSEFIRKQKPSPGWYIDKGYVWQENSRLLYKKNNFHKLCGTSNIMHRDILQFPSSIEEADEDFVKYYLGSHEFIREKLIEKDLHMKKIPFCGAVYRIGSVNAHTKTESLWQLFFKSKEIRNNPLKFLVRVVLRFHKIRFMSNSLIETFFGSNPVPTASAITGNTRAGSI